MVKGILFLITALIIIAAIYFAGLGLVKLFRALVREDDLDEAAELRIERRALAEENDRTEDLIRKARRSQGVR